MDRKRFIIPVAVIALFLFSSLAMAQYEDDPYIEGSIGGNYTLPSGYIKNDLSPDSINASSGLGLNLGLGYYVNSKLITGLYFSARNMGTDGTDMNHRAFEVGAYGKYLFMDLTETSFSPYLKLSGGVVFSKLVTKVNDDNSTVLRELVYNPAPGLDLALGIHYKTNSFGALYFELGYHYDLMKDIAGEYKNDEYPWGDNNQFLMVRLGVLFNIGPKE